MLHVLEGVLFFILTGSTGHCSPYALLPMEVMNFAANKTASSYASISLISRKRVNIGGREIGQMAIGYLYLSVATEP